MSQLIDISSNNLSENTFCFHDGNLDSEQVPVPLENAKFGTLNFKAVTSSETNNELDLLFSVDCSGSMSDKCSDNRSKMQHIIHTLKNMIMFFNDHPNIKVNITINSFDSNIYENIPRTKVNSENIAEIISRIEKITPLTSTNIELALKNAGEKISELKRLYPDNVINHIFMTDGDATEGSRDINKLKDILDNEITHSFIGFGMDHDASLLNGIGSSGKNGYYFIDKLEYAGLVYGEILHGIIYKILDDGIIEIENGLIYNYKTNTWCESLAVGSIVSEANKRFNIICSNPDECRITIKGTMDDIMLALPSTKITDANLTRDIYRQRTLQLLYKVNEFCNKKREMNNNIYFIRDEIDGASNGEKKKLKLELMNLLEEIKKYMEDNNLNEDKTLKNLCDDIYISYRTLGTRIGTMFCTSRLTSQGSQRQYTASNTHTIDTHTIDSHTLDSTTRTPLLLRHNHVFRFNDDDEEDEDQPILRHEVSDYGDTPYLSPQANDIMRAISRSINEDDDDDSTQRIY